MRDRLIVALDVPDAERALALARTLQGTAGWVKVGMTLFYAEGPSIIRDLRSMGFKVFVDLKLHDIPHQVEGACRTLTRAGADMFTVHASGGRAMLEAAVRATSEAADKFKARRPDVVAVTVLTSLGAEGLAELAVERSPLEQVEAMARMAAEAGCEGVVCSPLEASAVRAVLGPDALVVTPGIRAADDDAGDQARTATPVEALEAGASHLVVGRPITAADDPAAAARAMVKEMAR